MHTCEQERRCQVAVHKKKIRGLPIFKATPLSESFLGLFVYKKRQNLSSADAGEGLADASADRPRSPAGVRQPGPARLRRRPLPAPGTATQHREEEKTTTSFHRKRKKTKRRPSCI